MLTLTDSQDGNTSLDSGIERRRGLRIAQNRPIKIFEPTISRYFGGQTQDVSATGLRLELPRSLPLCAGKLLTIHVGLNEKGQPLANRRQMIPARVVWVNRSSDPSRATLSAGIEFVANTSAQLDAA
jgi:PilZ domain-containing protein